MNICKAAQDDDGLIIIFESYNLMQECNRCHADREVARTARTATGGSTVVIKVETA